MTALAAPSGANTIKVTIQNYICGMHGASMKGTVILRGVALPTPIPSTGPRGHVVDDHFQEAFPDEVGGETSGSDLFLFPSGALGILVLVRPAWVIRHG